MIMKYKVGDIVKVREDLEAGKDFGKLCVCYPMVKFAGKLVTISSVNNNDDDYHIEEDDGEYYWIDGFFEDENEENDNCCVDKIIEEGEKESDEYIINKVLSEMSEETKNIIIKEMIKGENCISIVAVPVYETICRRNGISIQRIVGTKYSVTVVSKDGTVVL
jgi:hypothetical protein